MIDAAKREIMAASLLAAGGFQEQAVSRTYYAVFDAAVAALSSISVTRSKHAGVIAAFNREIVSARGFDRDTAKTLRRLFERRAAADYGASIVSAEEAQDAIRAARVFVAAVEDWLKS